MFFHSVIKSQHWPYQNIPICHFKSGSKNYWYDKERKIGENCFQNCSYLRFYDIVIQKI